MSEWNIHTVAREEWLDEFLNMVKQIPKNANNPNELLKIAKIQATMIGELRGLSQKYEAVRQQTVGK